MMDYEKLVEALRCKCDDCEGCDLAFFDNDEGWMCQYAAKDDDAADAIEALLKENKELIEDHPEMVEADGHWEWRKPNGEVLLPKQGEQVGVLPTVDTVQCSICGGQLFSAELETPYCPYCGAKMREAQE